MVVEAGLEHIGGQDTPIYFECPSCYGAMGIDFIELKHTGRIVRKATCLNGKCAVRIFTRTAMGKHEPVLHGKGFRLFCTHCAEETARLYLHKRGMVCEKCLSVD